MGDRVVGERVEQGERPCRECGKRHWSWHTGERSRGGELFAPNWRDPDNGHPYQPVPWDELARTWRAERDSLLEVVGRVREWAQEHAIAEDAGLVEEMRDPYGEAAREVLSLLDRGTSERSGDADSDSSPGGDTE